MLYSVALRLSAQLLLSCLIFSSNFSIKLWDKIWNEKLQLKAMCVPAKCVSEGEEGGGEGGALGVRGPVGEVMDLLHQSP